MHRTFAAALLGAALGFAPLAGLAQGATTQPAASSAAPSNATAAPTKAKKPPSEAQKAQRERMKSCSAEWKSSGQKGRAAHSAFMKECLKKKT